MGFDANKMNDTISFQPSKPAPCTTGCDFFGTAATNGFCSKCYCDLQIKQKQAASSKAVVDKLVNNTVSCPPQTPSSSSSSPGSKTRSGSGSRSELTPVAPMKEKMSNQCLIRGKL